MQKPRFRPSRVGSRLASAIWPSFRRACHLVACPGLAPGVCSSLRCCACCSAIRSWLCIMMIVSSARRVRAISCQLACDARVPVSRLFFEFYRNMPVLRGGSRADVHVGWGCRGERRAGVSLSTSTIYLASSFFDRIGIRIHLASSSILRLTEVGTQRPVARQVRGAESPLWWSRPRRVRDGRACAELRQGGRQKPNRTASSPHRTSFTILT